MLFLLLLAWQALSGGFRQIRRARTVGQQVETLVQIECGGLSLLVVLTCFWQRQWAAMLRTAWALCLAAAAGLSALVWGPPMPLVGAFLAGMALLISRGVIQVLQRFAGDPPQESHSRRGGSLKP